jgi:hypothetical protein
MTSTKYIGYADLDSRYYAEFRTMPGKLDQSGKTTPKISLRAI